MAMIFRDFTAGTLQKLGYKLKFARLSTEIITLKINSRLYF